MLYGEPFFKLLAKPTKRDFISSISKPLSLIAEIKHASPSIGDIDFLYPQKELASIYEKAGASAISLVTEPNYFRGSIMELIKIVDMVKIPILMKDFICDEFQIYEGRAYGADAVLLIAAILTDEQIKKYLSIIQDLNMGYILEVHTENELKRALDLGVKVIGINNRDLTTFIVDPNTTFNLLKMIPSKKDHIIVSESGIFSKEQVDKLRDAGVNAVLIGRTLLEAKDPAAKIKELGF